MPVKQTDLGVSGFLNCLSTTSLIVMLSLFAQDHTTIQELPSASASLPSASCNRHSNSMPLQLIAAIIINNRLVFAGPCYRSGDACCFFFLPIGVTQQAQQRHAGEA